MYYRIWSNTHQTDGDVCLINHSYLKVGNHCIVGLTKDDLVITFTCHLAFLILGHVCSWLCYDFLYGGVGWKPSYLFVVFRDILDVENSHSKCLALVVIPKDGAEVDAGLKVEPEVEVYSAKVVVWQPLLSPWITLNILSLEFNLLYDDDAGLSGFRSHFQYKKFKHNFFISLPKPCILIIFLHDFKDCALAVVVVYICVILVSCEIKNATFLSIPQRLSSTF